MDDSIAWIVDDLSEFMNKSDIDKIIANFNQTSKRTDPVVHFYEHFLSQYNPELKSLRGVYYTPEPVVSYIVRSVDEVLKKHFNLASGLADNSMMDVTKLDGSKESCHRVQILDPASGTGTFLYEIINHIYESFKGNEGLWPSYVSKHLLPRLHGFELLMAPYAVAHLKLALRLKETGYKFEDEARLQIYLTNTLEEANEYSGLPLFDLWLTQEAKSAAIVKKNIPVMTIVGNPPYSGHSANTGKWISKLIKGLDLQAQGKKQKTHNYFEVDKKPIKDRQLKWLHDDYVKFIRFSQWKIESTGQGVLAFISNHGYFDNTTFRGMRQALMQSFNKIYLLDLHGNANKSDTDQNVFDIKQGVAIGIFIKTDDKKSGCEVFHCDRRGTRAEKYEWLETNDINSTSWTPIQPITPRYRFRPSDNNIQLEFGKFFALDKAMPIHSTGIVTARDKITIRLRKGDLADFAKDFVSLSVADARKKFKIKKDTRDWKIEKAQEDIKPIDFSQRTPDEILYHPFDIRHTYYTGKTKGFHCMPMSKVMDNMLLGKNMAISTSKSLEGSLDWESVFVSRMITQLHTTTTKETNHHFPLYLYSKIKKINTQPPVLLKSDLAKPTSSKQANFSEDFIKYFSKPLKLKYVPDGVGDLKTSFGPEDLFAYIYAILNSEGYRTRYLDALRDSFPHIPSTKQKTLFFELVSLGHRLINLHTLSEGLNQLPSYPVQGNNKITAIKYIDGVNGGNGQIWINKTQYFGNVSLVSWLYQIGGRPICESWLKDRKGLELDSDELECFRKIVVCLDIAKAVAEDIESAVDKHGGWPLA